MALIASPETRSHLLALPTEVRIEIYNYLFEGAQLSAGTTHATSPDCGFTVCSCAFPWHILRTCRQLRHEALPYLLAATTVEVSSTVLKTVNIPPSYLSAIPRAVVLNTRAFTKMPLQLEQFSSLRLLELRNVIVWCKFFAATYLESEQGDSSMYRLVMFNLGRISTALAELCTGTERGFKIHLCCQFVVSSLKDATLLAVIDVDSKTILRKSRGPMIKDRHPWAGYY